MSVLLIVCPEFVKKTFESLQGKKKIINFAPPRKKEVQTFPEMIVKKGIPEISRFALVGLIATAIHYALYYLCLRWTGHNAAYSIGYALSFVCNYVLSVKFTFRVPFSLSRFVGFSVSHLLNYLAGVVLLNIMIWAGIPEGVAPLPVFVLVVPINFLLVRYALTRRKEAHDAYYLTLIMAGIAMFWLQVYDAPTLSDDMLYRFVWLENENSPVRFIRSLGDLFSSQAIHYQLVNGRFVVHLIGQAMLCFVPPMLFQLISTVLFVVLLHCVVKWTRTSCSYSLPVLIWTLLLLFVVFSGFRTAMLWSIGTVNYLWVLSFTMLFLLYIRRAENRPATRFSWLMAPVAVLVGWSHEALSVPLSAVFALMLIVPRLRPRSNLVRLMALFYIMGTLLCLASPGIWGRAGGEITLQARLLSGAMNLLTNMRVGWILLIVLLTIRFKKNYRDFGRRLLTAHWHRQRLSYSALAVSLAIIAVCGTNLERVAFFTDFIAMMILLDLVAHGEKFFLQRNVIIAAIAVMAVLYVPALLVRKDNLSTWQYAYSQMKQPGTEVVGVPMERGYQGPLANYFYQHYANSAIEFGFFCSYMGFDFKDTNIRCAAALAGKERIIFLPEDVLRRIDSDSTAYTDYQLDESGNLYVWRLQEGQQVKGVTFELNDEDPSTLWPHQRLVAYKGRSYDLDDFLFEDLTVGGQRFLVFTKPTTNIYRRINHISLKTD